MGGFVANIGYALVLLAKNKNFHNYTDKGCGVGYAKSALTGIAWYAALGVYGIASVAEVAMTDPSGKIIVTLETRDEDEIVAAMNAMQRFDGVVNVALVFHQSDA